MKHLLLTLCLSCVLVAQQAQTAPKPNLSGTWELDPKSSELVANSSFKEGTVWVIHHDETKLTIVAKNALAPAQSAAESKDPLIFKTDGKPATVVLGIPQTAAASLDGSKAVIHWNQSAPATPTAPASGPVRRRSLTPFTWTLFLSQDAKALILEVQILDANAESGQKVVFRRKA
jgi:hypothetical protein